MSRDGGWRGSWKRRNGRPAAQIYKVIKKQVRADTETMAQLGVAKEFGMTLGQLRREMTREELQLWLIYFDVRNDMQSEAMEKARRRSR